MEPTVQSSEANDVGRIPNALSAAGSEARSWAIYAPASALVSGWLGPLIIYLIKKPEGDSAALRSARDTLNFQITLVFAYLVSFVLTLVFIGVFLMLGLFVANVVFSILHAIKASNGEEYRYPFSLHLIKP